MSDAPYVNHKQSNSSYILAYMYVGEHDQNFEGAEMC